ncbi:MAG: 4Fe-4S binding protein [Deltaproteobacteria bacterium]|nr:4Fe-4S binding protein [Deltaproteobacteria bacterium]
MRILSHMPPVLSILILAAHFLRIGNWGATVAVLFFLSLFFWRHRWMLGVLRTGFALGTLFWLKITLDMILVRMALGEPWIRLSIIMGAVALLSATASVQLYSGSWTARFYKHQKTARWSAAAFFLTCGLLAIVQLKVARPMLLPERFIPGGGWMAVVGLSVYAAILVQKMSSPQKAHIWRKRIWVLFSATFFFQFIIGVLGVESFLMSGKLHVPVPAVILAGPIYRGEGFFMPILFGITLLLVGPAWCSHLCYFGGLDLLAATRQKRPGMVPQKYSILRIGLLVGVIGIALLMRLWGISGFSASVVAVVFGAAGMIAMATVSRQRGVMFHCVSVCPIGLIAVIMGKISPFRMRFTASCNACGACSHRCRYGALERTHIDGRAVGMNCTLCGDCMSRCKENGLTYTFGRWTGPSVRMTFIVCVVVLHGVFLGVARL